MIVNVVEIFTEYLSVILCEHKIAKKKVALDRYFWMFFLLDLFSILLAHDYRKEHGWLMMLVYVNFFVYVKMRLCKKWADAVKVFGGMFILIPCLQLLMYYCVKFCFSFFYIVQERYVVGIVVNCVNCLLIILWKKRYISILANLLRKTKGFFVFLPYALLTIIILYFFRASNYILEPITLQAVVAVILIGAISILWINAENDKKIKTKELQLYETYNKTFEEAVIAIRLRQHEFDNHINAIKCLQFTINDSNELLKVQNEYCDKILEKNSFNRLLKVNTDPILIAFLYSKFVSAAEKKISINYEVHAIEIKRKIEITELIEVIGILFDNAVEALQGMDGLEKKLLIKILQEDNQGIAIEIANVSRRFLNSEIEKFFVSGYTTKGENRGIGLSRVNEIVKRYRANLYIGNVSYNNENYLSFRIVLL